EEAPAMPESLPELLREVGSHGAEEAQRHLHRLPQQGAALLAGSAIEGVALEVVEGVDQLHDRADRRIEMEIALHVGGDPADRLANHPAERPAPLPQVLRRPAHRVPELPTARASAT